MLITRGFGAKEIEYVSVPVSDLTMTSDEIGTKSMDAYELKPSMTGQVEIQDGPRIVNTFPPA